MTEPIAHPAADCGCGEFATTRRRFLQGTSAVVAGAALSTTTGGVFRQVAFGAGPRRRNVLVVLSLRGGVDGLSLVVPYGDRGYAYARPRAQVPEGTLLKVDDTFGLNPAFRPLWPMWNDARFAAVQAVGLPVPNRSHFAAMEEMEDADLGSPARRGWLNRMIGLDSVDSPLQAVQMGNPLVPTSLYGNAPVVASRSLADLRITGGQTREALARRRRALRRTWGDAGGSLGRGARSAMRTVERVDDLTRPKQPANGARYPTGDLGKALRDTARLIRADRGVETVTIDYGNWDHHVNVVEGVALLATDLARALAAFFTDLGAHGDRVTLVTISEFGRRVHENGARGADHGWGNVMLLLGAGVRGGRVYGEWPGLGPTALREGDLQVTRDYRTVLSEVLQARFPHVSVPKIFPGYRLGSESVGVMRPAG
jgi:uncharacterized protein (DUF1501 family)